MAKKKEVTRAYHFSDAFLVQLTDHVNTIGTRDNTELNSLGVTAVRLAAVVAKRNTFDDLADDEELEGDVSEKTEDRDTAAAAAEVFVNSIRTMAQNIFGESTAKYRGFRFDGINDLEHAQRVKAYKRVKRRAADNLAALTPEGLTAPMLTNFGNANGDYDDAIDALDDAITDRDIATEDRIEKGNEIYAELVKICNTGKNYWIDKNEAKYNDYVIYDTPSGAPEPAK